MEIPQPTAAERPQLFVDDISNHSFQELALIHTSIDSTQPKQHEAEIGASLQITTTVDEHYSITRKQYNTKIR